MKGMYREPLESLNTMVAGVATHTYRISISEI